ncbi:hypothetical protein G7Y89_g7058 [Cudoniella acicularis]|uniref:Myb-like domain-containing protein n=1 Tax=Cudoniella acicularis TaxID=354080 RepID=A0A8H4W1W3_9HELO|nr:hypothetical protein G7Y89_g7058 [Cudoniella acicularis]
MKTPTSSKTATQLTPAEGILFQTILLSMKNAPQVDWAVVAQKANYKSREVARIRYWQIMRRLQAAEAQGNETLASPDNFDTSTDAKSLLRTPKAKASTAFKVTKSKGSPVRKGKVKAESVEKVEKELHSSENSSKGLFDQEMFDEAPKF